VRLEYRDRNAHAAFVAVTKGFHTADTAETALNAVKGLLGLQWNKRYTCQ
jgi:hypothetical protein